jgi:CRP-like cAMP-binding protein
LTSVTSRSAARTLARDWHRLGLMSAIISCASCPCGQAAGVGNGGRCPLVDRRRARGETIYVEGEIAHHVWFVKRGSVVLTRAGADGGEHARAVRRAGAFIGLEALVQPSYVDSARVASPAVLCGAPLADIDAWLGGKETPLRMALEQVLRAEVTDLPRAAGPDGRALERVARWILDQGTGDDAPVARRYVAGLLGMAPETFSRALTRLADRGAIEVTRTSLRVVDANALRHVATHAAR